MSTAHGARTPSSKLDRAAEVADELQQRVRKGVEDLVEDGRDTLTGVREQVRERPLTALAIAGGIGLLLGVLIARRR